ncbi:TVP38/TMEM64 family protein [Geodermatophilus saharensis]|uniref:TVP38/TMEM64 family protein n=1 Tax=Geodermatophilus saharensis TaxID=1137994 RepID=UPI0011404977|nr:VTT domain-containing protein [Geodermatophilus saharensis]
MRRTWVRAGALVAVLAVGTVVALTVDVPDVATVRGWIDRTGTPGLLLLTAGVGLALVGPVPRTAMSVLLGVVLGFWGGTAVALAGGMLGGLAAFALSRTLGRDAVARLEGPRLAAVDRVLADRGFGAVLAGRLLPVVPFSVLSHAAGLSAVPLGSYAAATALGLLPSTVLQVGVGASVPELTAWAARAGSPGVAVAVTALVVGGAVLLWRRRARSRTSAG